MHLVCFVTQFITIHGQYNIKFRKCVPQKEGASVGGKEQYRGTKVHKLLVNCSTEQSVSRGPPRKHLSIYWMRCCVDTRSVLTWCLKWRPTTTIRILAPWVRIKFKASECVCSFPKFLSSSVKHFAKGVSTIKSPTKYARTGFREEESGMCPAALHCRAYRQTDQRSCP